MSDSAGSSVIHFPELPMARYGLIPAEYGGGNKYRVIWSASRTITLTGYGKTMTVPLYVGRHALEPIGECWIIEGWKSPEELCGRITPDEWNANPLYVNVGPYPSKGDYVLREALSCNPSDANIEKLITWLEAGGKRRPIENTLACIDNMERDIKSRKDAREALLKDAMLPFGGEAYSAAGGGRGTKTIEQKYTGNELGLPGAGQVGDGSRFTKRVVYEVPQETA